MRGDTAQGHLGQASVDGTCNGGGDALPVGREGWVYGQVGPSQEEGEESETQEGGLAPPQTVFCFVLLFLHVLCFLLCFLSRTLGRKGEGERGALCTSSVRGQSRIHGWPGCVLGQPRIRGWPGFVQGQPRIRG